MKRGKKMKAFNEEYFSKIDPAWIVGGGMTMTALGIKAVIDANATAATATAIGNGIAYVGLPLLGAFSGAGVGSILGATHGIVGTLVNGASCQALFSSLGALLGGSATLNVVQATAGNLVPTVVSALGIGAIAAWAPYAIAAGTLVVGAYVAKKNGWTTKLAEAFKEGYERHEAKPRETKKGLFSSFLEGYRKRRDRKINEINDESVIG